MERYLIPFRLADVLILLQVLAKSLGKEGGGTTYGHRSEKWLQENIRKPQSANDWRQIVAEHSEFFRFSYGDNPTLTVRWVNPQYVNDPLPDELLGQLMKIAIELHDRQDRRRRDRFSFVKAVVVAVIAAVGTLMATMVGVAMGKVGNTLP